MRNKEISLFAATVQYSVVSLALKNICRDLKTVNKWLTLRYTVELLYSTKRNGEVDMMMK